MFHIGHKFKILQKADSKAAAGKEERKNKSCMRLMCSTR